MAYTFKLISSELCPYAERSRIVMAHKNVVYDTALIDLKNKPSWFLEVSPRGKVPVLLVNEQPYFESSAIAELLDELVPDPPMMPSTPFLRAEARAWIAFCNEEIMPIAAKIWFSKDHTQRLKDGSTLRASLGKLEDFLEANPRGPLLLGHTLSLLDVVFAPLFNRWDALTQQLDGRNLLDTLPLLSTYRNNLLGQSAVKTATIPNINQRLLDTFKQTNALGLSPEIRERYRQALLRKGHEIATKLAEVLAGLDVRLENATPQGFGKPGMRPEEKLRMYLDFLNAKRRDLENDDPAFNIEGIEHLVS